MGIHLPGEVGAALTDAGLSLDEAQDKTGDELREAIGDRLAYDLIVTLAGQRETVARWPGKRAKMPADELIERNLDVLRCRLVDGLSFKAIGREVGLTGGRAAEILRVYFGVDVKSTPAPKVLRVKADDVPVLRAALLMRLRELAEDLTDEDADWSEVFEQMQEVRYLLREVEDDDEDVEMHVGAKRRGPVVRQALEGYPRDRDVRDRLLAAMP